MKYLLSLFLLVTISALAAPSYSTGLPMPGLPKSVGPKPMSGSTSVTLATDQTPITVTGSITATNPSVGTNSAAAPTSSTQIGYRDASGNLQPFIVGSQGITVSATGGVAITNTPTVNQGTTPWVVAAAITNTPTVVVSGGVAITNTPTVNQGTTPWVVAAAITNTPTVLQGTVPWVVAAAITNTPTVNQGTSPWVTSSSPVTVTSSSVSRVANSASSQTLLSANGSRKGIFLYNDGSSANCYVKFGATASATSFTFKMFYTDTYIMDPPTYTGVIDYICDAASGSMEVNEL